MCQPVYDVCQLLQTALSTFQALNEPGHATLWKNPVTLPVNSEPDKGANRPLLYMALLRRMIAVGGLLTLTALLLGVAATPLLAQLATPIFPSGQPVLTASPPPPWSKGQTVSFSITVNGFNDAPNYPNVGLVSQFFHGLGIHPGSCWTNITLGTPPPALNYTAVGRWIVDPNQPVLGFYFDSDNCDFAPFCPPNNDSRDNWGDLDPAAITNDDGPWSFSWTATVNAADPDTCSACMQAEVFVDAQTGAWTDDFEPDPRIGDYCDTIGIVIGSPICRDSVSEAIAFRRIRPNYIQSWNFDSAQVISGTGNGPYQLSWSTPGIRRVTHTITDTLRGITAVDTAIIEIGNRPTSLFAVDKGTLCAVIDTITVTYLGTGSPVAQYNWDFDGATVVSGSGQGPYRLVYPTAGTKAISLVVGSTNCQSDSTIVNLSVGDTANFNIVFTPFTCIDSAAVIISNFCSPPDGKTFSWDLDGGVLLSGSGAGPLYVRWPTNGTKEVIRFTRDALTGQITSRDTIQISVLPPLTNTFTVSDLAVCEGEEVIVTYRGNSIPFVNIFDWDFAGGTVVSGTGAGPYRIRWNTSGPKPITLLVRYPFILCNETRNVQTVMVSPAPDPNALFVTGGFCVSDTIQVRYNAPGTVLVNWDYDGGTVLFGGTSDIGPHFIRYSTPGIKNITMTATIGSCTVTRVQAINIGEIPALSAGPDLEVCGGGVDCVPLLATVNGDASTCTYSWFPTAGLSNPNAQQPIACPTQTTEYRVVALCPCGNDTDFVNVVVKPAPTWSSVPGTFEFCEGSGGFPLNVVANGGTGNLRYVWAPDSGLSNPNIQNPIANPSVTTTYTVTAVDANGCPSPTLRVTVRVNERPVVDLGPDTTICDVGGAYTFNPQVTGGTGNYAYQWLPATGLSCNNCPNPVLVTPGVSQTYSLVVTDQTTGCRSEIANPGSDIKVDVVTEPVVTVAATTVQVCLGDSVRIGALPVTGGDMSFEWSPTGGLSDPFAQAPMASPGATTVYTVRGIVGGCIGQTQTVTVEVLPVPTLSPVSPVLNVCPGDSVQLEVLLTGQQTLDSLLWTPANGLSNPRALQPNASPSANTTYTLTLYANGCSNPVQTSIDVVVDNVPTIDADTTNAPVFYCLGDPVGVTLPASIDSNFSVIINWTPATSLSDPNALNPVARPTQTTKYFLAVTSGSCTLIDSVEVIVRAGIDIDLEQNSFRICAGQPVQLEASAGIGSARFVWTPATGLDNPNSATPVATPLQTTMYYVTVTESGCRDVDSVLITVDPQAQADFSSTQLGGCGQMTVLFRDQSRDAVGWQWDFGDNSPEDTSQNPTHLYTQSGSYTVTLITEAAGGFCNDTIVKQAYVVIRDSLSGGFITNPQVGDTLYLADATLFAEDTTAGSVSWQWLFGDGSSAAGQAVNHTYRAPGTYNVSLIVVDANGCTDTIVRGPYLVLPPQIGFIPNVFTPNGDGIHDVFRVTYDGNEPFELLVYDRWGVSLYSSTDPTEGWNGLSNNSGSEVADGVYFYVLNIGDQRIKGTVTLLR